MIKLRYLLYIFVLALQFYGTNSNSKRVDSSGITMDSVNNDLSFFWKTLDLCDWKYEGDDERVLEPVIDYLSKQDDDVIFQFEEVMAKLLYQIDTKQNYEKFKDLSGDDSADTFLYARCVALVNGPDYYSAVERGKTDELWNMEFESLLYVAMIAWGRKHDKDPLDFPYSSTYDYETGSNKDGWK